MALINQHRCQRLRLQIMRKPLYGIATNVIICLILIVSADGGAETIMMVNHIHFMMQ